MYNGVYLYHKEQESNTKKENVYFMEEINMTKYYYVQVNDYMNPVRVELTESEANAVEYVLREIAKEDTDALVGISDETGTEIYGNYDEWIKIHK